PTGHTYITHPGSRLLFPTLCRPTATLWTGDPPQVPIRERRGAMMPRRAKTRAQNRAAYITAERTHNVEHRTDSPRGNDPPF
ncbi:HNH endonuclease, partial [Mycolicibacterium gilvum]|nr:HNH endonuclease [Mycolicibacterium gilvum]